MRLPLLFAAVFALPALAARLPDDAVVARVGSEPVLRKDLVSHLQRYYGRVALEQAIDRIVLGAEAARKKVIVSDVDVDASAAEAKKTLGDLKQALEREGISETTWRERLRYGVMAEKVRDSKWPVKDDDLERISVRYARLSTERLAKDLIRDAKQGTRFDLLVLQQSLDKENGGLVQPDPFMRVDQPIWFRLATEANLRPGAFTQQPIEQGGFWLVLKLEKRLGAETLKGAQREQAVRRVKGFRMMSLLPTSRRLYKVEYPTALSGEGSAADEMAKVTPLPAPGREKTDPESVTRKDLVAYLIENFGKAVLEQVVERSILSQAAAQARATVSEAELNTRAAALQRTLGKIAFQEALQREGITEDAWRERVRFEVLAENLVNAKYPPQPADLERMTVRYVRVATREEADRVLQAARSGAQFEQLQQQRSLDRNKDGFLFPRIFLKSENSQSFEAIRKAGLKAGDLLPQPLQLANGFYVLRLEARFPPELMSAKEREEAARKINAGRMSSLLDDNKKAYKVEYVVPIPTLAADARG